MGRQGGKKGTKAASNTSPTPATLGFGRFELGALCIVALIGWLLALRSGQGGAAYFSLCGRF